MMAATAVIWLLVLAWQAESAEGAGRWVVVLRLFAQRLRILAVALAWVLAVLGIGCEVGGLVLPDVARGERWLFRAGLGVGVSAVLILVVGALGEFWAIWGLWGLGITALARRIWAERRELREALGTRLALEGWEWLWVLVSVVVLILALISVFLPPLAYDVLEYHLGVPARYLEAGRIGGLASNVYSNFPLTAQMHYLVGLATLSKVEGGCFAKLLNVFFSAIAGLGVAALALACFRKRRVALLALAIFATTGWFLVLACAVAYVEPFLVALTVLAILALVRGVEAGPAGTRRLIVAGLLVGFACGTKYPAVLFLAVPAVAYLAFRSLVAPSSGKLVVARASVFAVAAVLAFSPWLLKNLLVTGNPVFPLLQGLFDGGGWGAAAQARWEQAHPLGISQAGRLLGQLGQVLFRTDHELPALIFSPAAFVFIPLLHFFRERRGLVLHLVGYVILCVLVWLLFTHRILRFLVPAAAVATALSAGAVEALKRERLRTLLRVAAALLMGMSLFMAWPFLPKVWAADLSRPAEFFQPYLRIYPYPACTFAEALPAGERMLSVGEARSFYFGPNVHTETVFDPKLLDALLADDPQPGELARRLKQRGFAYIFLNWWELSRLQATYAYQYGGRRHAGYSEGVNSTLLDRLEAGGHITPVRGWGPSVYTVETPEGWRYPPLDEPPLPGVETRDEAVIAFHPAVYMIYRIEGRTPDD